MSLRTYVNIWLISSFLILYEYLALNFYPQMSLLYYVKHHLQVSKFFNELNLSPDPGRQISLYLGWAGIIIMLMMNVYTLKKRIKIFSNIGPGLARTFDFHIFCGLVGPTMILFHSNMKVRGLVAISFWSMVISATSGIFGRYLYGQLLSKKHELKVNADKVKVKLENEFKKQMPELPPERQSEIMQEALEYVGMPSGQENKSLGGWQVVRGSLLGDLRLFWAEPDTIEKLPPKIRNYLTRWAIATRMRFFLDPLQRIMGYWHAFHLPFAFFMYGAAVIHIVTALLFGVKK